jgi:hypothetical protein
MHQTSLRPAIVLALTLAACAGDTLTAPAPGAPEAALARNVATSRVTPSSHRISGRCELTTLSTTPYPAAPVFRQIAEGKCKFSHIGRATVHFVQLVNFATGTQRSLELSYTAANGDILRAASAGTSAPSAGGVSFSATITFLGGTGRFENVTGEMHANGTATLVAGTSEYTVDGQISYTASDRAGS